MPLPIVAPILTALLGNQLRVWFFLFLGSVIPYLAKGIVQAFGIGLVTYAGVSFGLEALLTSIQTKYYALPVQLFQTVEMLGVTNALSIVIAGMTSALSIKVASGLTRVRVSDKGAIWNSPTQ